MKTPCTLTHTLLALLSSVAIAKAAIVTWDAGGGGDTDWGTATNWTGDALPASADTAVINSGYTAVYSGTPASEIVSTINVGTGGGGTSTLNITGSSLEVESGGIFIGRFGGNTGVLNITGGTFIDDNFAHNWVGANGGSGQLNISGTGQMITSDLSFWRIGKDGAVTGSVTMSDNASWTKNPGVVLDLEINGTAGSSGSFTILDNAIFSGRLIYLGGNDGNSTFNMSDNSQFTLDYAPVGFQVTDGAGNEQISISGGVLTTPRLVVTLDGPGGGTDSFSFTGGTINATTSTINLPGTQTLSVGAGSTLNLGTGTHTITDGLDAHSGGLVQVGGSSTSVGSLGVTAGPLGGGTIENVSGLNRTLTTGSDNTSTTYAGVLRDNAGGGMLALTKEGTGTLTLSGNNTYSGGTTISAGTLSMNSANAVGTGTITMGHATLHNGASGPASINNDLVSGSGWFFWGTGSKALEINGDWTNNSAITWINPGGTLTFNGDVSSLSPIYGNGGTIALTNPNNSFASTPVITHNSTLQFTTIANSGVNSSLGAGSEIQFDINAGQNMNGTIENIGAGGSTDRSVTFGAHNGNNWARIDNNGTGALDFSGTFTNNSNAGATRELRLGGNYAGTNTISSLLSDGTGGGKIALTKEGSTTWTLTGTNTYTGGTTVNDGTLQIGDGTNNTASVAGTTTLSGGNLAYDLSANNFGVNGAITLTNAATITKLNGAVQQNFSGGTLNGGGQTLNINVDTTDGTKPLYFNQTAGTALGQVNILNGAVGQDGAGGLPLQGAAMNVANGAQFRTFRSPTINNDITLNGGAGPDSLGALYNEGAGTPDYTGTITLTNATDSSIGTGGGNINVSGQVTGGGDLTKISANTLTLSGTNTYTGNTTVDGGTLALVSSTSNNNIAGSSLISVGSGSTLDVTGITATGGFEVVSGQTLAGEGNVAGNTTINSGAFLSPGDGGIGGIGDIGVLSFQNAIDVSTASPGSLLFDLGTGSTSDTVSSGGLLGTLDIGVGSLNLSSFTFNDLGIGSGGTYVLFDASSGGAIDGTIANNAYGELFGLKAVLSQSATQVLLTVSVPEPSSTALLGLGLSSLLLRRRR